jgi:NAD(P)-dependent dehydrogenase (short-subunit alcohol dehydrogenase family)
MSIVPDLAEQVAVVIGGASGIGAGTARGFAELGATVIVADARPGPGQLHADVTEPASLETLAATIRTGPARVDHLVLCAGTVRVGRLQDSTETDWDAVFDVNAKGAWRTVRALLPLVPDGGSIVTVSSGAGLRPIPELPLYAASKAALIGLSKALAVDLAGRGIRVNCVCPGLVDTPMARQAQEARGTEAAAEVSGYAQYLLKRAGTAEELAAAIVSLAVNPYITGSTLAVDGGRTLH